MLKDGRRLMQPPNPRTATFTTHLGVAVASFALCACMSGERARNHERVLTEGAPRLAAWTHIAVPGTFGWFYDPVSVAHGDGKAYVWTRVPVPSARTAVLERFGFDCSRHLESQGPTVTWETDTVYNVPADKITSEDDHVTDWDAFGADEEPLYKMTCTAFPRE